VNRVSIVPRDTVGGNEDRAALIDAEVFAVRMGDGSEVIIVLVGHADKMPFRAAGRKQCVQALAVRDRAQKRVSSAEEVAGPVLRGAATMVQVMASGEVNTAPSSRTAANWLPACAMVKKGSGDLTTRHGESADESGGTEGATGAGEPKAAVADPAKMKRNNARPGSLLQDHSMASFMRDAIFPWNPSHVHGLHHG